MGVDAPSPEDPVTLSYPELRKVLKPMGDPQADAVVSDSPRAEKLPAAH